jgi:hypothetical protein
VETADHRPKLVGSADWRAGVQAAQQMELFARDPSVFSGQL